MSTTGPKCTLIEQHEIVNTPISSPYQVINNEWTGPLIKPPIFFILAQSQGVYSHLTDTKQVMAQALVKVTSCVTCHDQTRPCVCMWNTAFHLAMTFELYTQHMCVELKGTPVVQ